MPYLKKEFSVKQFLIAALFLTAAGAAIAAPQDPRPGDAPQGARAEAPSPERFAEHKQRMLERLTQHSQALAKARECVQAAKSPQDLRECRPESGRKGPEGRGHRADGAYGEPRGEMRGQGEAGMRQHPGHHGAAPDMR